MNSDYYEAYYPDYEDQVNHSLAFMKNQQRLEREADDYCNIPEEERD